MKEVLSAEDKVKNEESKKKGLFLADEDDHSESEGDHHEEHEVREEGKNTDEFAFKPLPVNSDDEEGVWNKKFDEKQDRRGRGGYRGRGGNRGSFNNRGRGGNRGSFNNRGRGRGREQQKPRSDEKEYQKKEDQEQEQ